MERHSWRIRMISFEQTRGKLPVSIIVIGEREKLDNLSRFVYGVGEDKALEDVHTPLVLHGCTERLESLREFKNLNNLFIQSIPQCFISGTETFDLLFAARLDVNAIWHPCHSNNSFMPFILRNLPFSRFVTSLMNSGLKFISSTGCQSCSSIQTKSSSDSGSLSTNFLNNESFFSFSASDSMPCLAISVHFISGWPLTSFSNSPETDNVIFTQSPYIFNSHNYLKSYANEAYP